MKRQKNYRQLRSKSAARNRLNEIKSRTDTPVARQSNTSVQPPDKSLFDETPEKPDYGEPPEDRFSNTPLPDFQFDWDEEFFGTASPGSNGAMETIAFEIQPVEEKPEITLNEGLKQDTVSLIQTETTGNNIPETIEPAPVAIEIQPERKSFVNDISTPARFVSVKRQKAIEAKEAEKTKKTSKHENSGVKAKSTRQKPASGISEVETKSGPSSLNVRRTPSFRSFVISTIRRLMEEQRFLASEPESSRFLMRELATSKPEEPAESGSNTREPAQGGATRWNKPLNPAASASLGYNAGAKLQKSYSSKSKGEKPSPKQNKPAGAKSKLPDESFKLNTARFNLMEALINARAITGNMKMKW